MHCPNCHAENLEDDPYCRQCGTDLVASSKSLITSQYRLPAVLHNPQFPRVAAGVGAVAMGVGIELLCCFRKMRSSTNYPRIMR